MTLVEAHANDLGIPYDTFGARLAVLRSALGGWNVKKAADLCGIDDQTWRKWEAGVSKPRDLEDVCARIAAATGCSYEWLMVGGPLASFRWSTVSPAQGELFDQFAAA